MQLPDSERHEKKVHKRKTPTGLVVLCVLTIIISLASAGFSVFVYLNTPQQIDKYVQTHKSQLKGDKGDSGPMGPMGLSGLNGNNSYAPTHCSSYDFGTGYLSTNCY
jgi:hypothetical protein